MSIKEREVVSYYINNSIIIVKVTVKLLVISYEVINCCLVNYCLLVCGGVDKKPSKTVDYTPEKCSYSFLLFLFGGEHIDV